MLRVINIKTRYPASEKIESGNAGKYYDVSDQTEGHADAALFLAQRFQSMRRAMFSGVPHEPKQGDLGPVMDAVGEIVDAAGSLEYSRVQLHRVLNVAQAEFAAAQM